MSHDRTLVRCERASILNADTGKSAKREPSGPTHRTPRWFLLALRMPEPTTFLVPRGCLIRRRVAVRVAVLVVAAATTFAF